MLILSIRSASETSFIFLPFTSICPDCMSQNLAIKAAIVDLPDPEGPTKAVMVFFFISNVIP